MQERLQKILARAGFASRRGAEELITSGRVRVNSVVISEVGNKADPFVDKIEVDGQRIMLEDFVYVVLHKPKNVVSTLRDPEGRPTVGDILARTGKRLYPVGRLDFATSGVLLATNDGDFANGLLHPKRAVPKTYVVKVQGLMLPDDIKAWSKGIVLEDGMTLPATVRLIRHEDEKTWFEITITEGRNQQIRRMGDATNFRVMRLARVNFAGITHEGLRPGAFRIVTADELRKLREAYGVPKRVPKIQSLDPRSAGRERDANRIGGAVGRGPSRGSTDRRPGAGPISRTPSGDRGAFSERKGPGDRKGPAARGGRSTNQWAEQPADQSERTTPRRTAGRSTSGAGPSRGRDAAERPSRGDAGSRPSRARDADEKRPGRAPGGNSSRGKASKPATRPAPAHSKGPPKRTTKPRTSRGDD